MFLYYAFFFIEGHLYFLKFLRYFYTKLQQFFITFLCDFSKMSLPAHLWPFLQIFLKIFSQILYYFFTKKYIFLFYSVKYILYTMSKCSTQLNILKNFLCHFLLKNDLFFARFFQKMRSIFYRICGFSCACR